MADAPNLNRKGTLWAAFVGVNHYDDRSNFPPLSFCANDASALAALFQDRRRGWHSLGKMSLLIQPTSDPYLSPTRSNIIATVGDLSQIAKEEDVVLFGFFGHGLADGEESYLIPSDGRLHYPEETALRLTWVIEALKRSNARVKILIVDACHSGLLPDGRAGGSTMSSAMARTLQELGDTEGWAVLSSCGRDEKAWEYGEKQHGAFTYFLLEGLRGAADRDRDGLVTMSELNRYVAPETSKWALANSKRQTPELRYYIRGGDIAFLANPEHSPSIGPPVGSDSWTEAILRLFRDDSKFSGTFVEREKMPRRYVRALDSCELPDGALVLGIVDFCGFNFWQPPSDFVVFTNIGVFCVTSTNWSNQSIRGFIRYADFPKYEFTLELGEVVLWVSSRFGERKGDIYKLLFGESLIMASERADPAETVYRLLRSVRTLMVGSG